jgi:hypothetical protein
MGAWRVDFEGETGRSRKRQNAPRQSPSSSALRLASHPPPPGASISSRRVLSVATVRPYTMTCAHERASASASRAPRRARRRLRWRFCLMVAFHLRLLLSLAWQPSPRDPLSNGKLAIVRPLHRLSDAAGIEGMSIVRGPGAPSRLAFTRSTILQPSEVRCQRQVLADRRATQKRSSLGSQRMLSA